MWPCDNIYSIGSPVDALKDIRDWAVDPANGLPSPLQAMVIGKCVPATLAFAAFQSFGDPAYAVAEQALLDAYNAVVVNPVYPGGWPDFVTKLEPLHE